MTFFAAHGWIEDWEGELRMATRRVRLVASFGLVGLMVSVMLFGAASLGRAGSGPIPSEFEFSVQPQFVTAGATGFVMGKFIAASGAGTGTASHVAMTFDLPTGFTPATGTSSGCSGPDSASTNVYTCNIGTVHAGQVVKRFVAFTAPSTLGLNTGFSGCVSFDNGSGGAGGGGGVNTCSANTEPGQITVVAVGDTQHAGTCTGAASTPAVTAADLQSSAVTGASASSSLGLPCTWVFVGEADAPPGQGVLSQVSFTGFPQTNAAATWIIEFYSLPAPFSQLDVLFDLDYTAGSALFSPDALPACTGANNTLGSTQSRCLQSFVKVKKGARAIILLLGTGGDPGAGLG